MSTRVTDEERAAVVWGLRVEAEKQRARLGDNCEGLLRRAARWIETHQCGDGESDAERCVCGRPIEQPATGRRARWCSPNCRKAASKRRRKSPIEP
jgi:hypothetical protein